MNHWAGMGRLTRDPEIINTSENTVAKYCLAVDRMSKDKATDFIPCICFDKTADFAEKYLKKGMKVAVEGRIRTGNYTNKEGKKIYTMDVIVNTHYFCESRGTGTPAEQATAENDNFMNVPTDIDEEVPFN